MSRSTTVHADPPEIERYFTKNRKCQHYCGTLEKVRRSQNHKKSSSWDQDCTKMNFSSLHICLNTTNKPVYIRYSRKVFWEWHQNFKS